jgi:hypothetical protein
MKINEISPHSRKRFQIIDTIDNIVKSYILSKNTSHTQPVDSKVVYILYSLQNKTICVV